MARIAAASRRSAPNGRTRRTMPRQERKPCAPLALEEDFNGARPKTKLQHAPQTTLTEAERQRLLALGADVEGRLNRAGQHRWGTDATAPSCHSRRCRRRAACGPQWPQRSRPAQPSSASPDRTGAHESFCRWYCWRSAAAAVIVSSRICGWRARSRQPRRRGASDPLFEPVEKQRQKRRGWRVATTSWLLIPWPGSGVGTVTPA